MEKKDKILVHICCGVDAVWGLRKIREEFPDAEIKGFFYDPNIHPKEEYDLRYIETERVCQDLGIECIKGEYELDKWIEATKGLENEPERGERCSVCHDLRLEETGKLAKELGFNKITTVLMMSPKKDIEVISKIGNKVASKYGLEFLTIDFRKKGGIEKMNKLSKEMELYHQNYCGCMYALFQQRNTELITELVRFGKGRPAGSREELLFIKEIRLYAEKIGLKAEEQEFQFIGWKNISSILKIDKQPVQHGVLYNSASIRGILRAKIKEIIEEADKTILKLNKMNAEIWVVDGSLEISLEEPRFLTNPIFIINKDTQFKENSKFELQLKSEFDPTVKSRNLIIGNKEAGEYIFFHSDTLPDGTAGFKKEEIINSINENFEKLKNGEIAIVILGAKHVGNIGKRVFQEEIVTKITE